MRSFAEIPLVRKAREGYARLRRRGRPDTASAAEAGVTTRHPILQVLDARSEQINTLIDNADRADKPTRRTLVTNEFADIADALVAAGPFDVSADNLPEIWQGVLTVFGGRMDMRRQLARVVTAAYAVQGTTDPRWKDFPREYNLIGKLPTVAREDEAGSAHVLTRVTDVMNTTLKIKEDLARLTDPADTNPHNEHDPNDPIYVRLKLADDFGNGGGALRMMLMM